MIIFDEIQEAANGLTVLKYFQEDAPQYHVTAAGSIRCIAINPKQSFPVGKVDFLKIYPRLDDKHSDLCIGFVKLKALVAKLYKDFLKRYMLGTFYTKITF